MWTFSGWAEWVTQSEQDERVLKVAPFLRYSLTNRPAASLRPPPTLTPRPKRSGLTLDPGTRCCHLPLLNHLWSNTLTHRNTHFQTLTISWERETTDWCVRAKGSFLFFYHWDICKSIKCWSHCCFISSSCVEQWVVSAEKAAAAYLCLALAAACSTLLSSV